MERLSVLLVAGLAESGMSVPFTLCLHLEIFLCVFWRDSMRPMDPVMEAGPTTVSASCRETQTRRDVTEESSSPSSASASCTGSNDPTCLASYS
ncbi:hypothetical protein MRX96_045227 [Rhipicephalus microplus]